MKQRTSRYISPVIESLESRALLSGVARAAVELPMAVDRGAIVVAAKAAKPAHTKTALAISAGTLGEPITFTAMVRAAASAGTPVGTVDIMDHRTVIATLTLSPAGSTSPKNALSEGTFTLTQPPGGGAYFIGKHKVSAVFVPAAGFAKSSANANINVAKPAYTPLANGVKFETIATGSGPAIQSGQMANVLYTGYLAKRGRIFDNSNSHAQNGFVAPLRFVLGSGQVILGFDEGTVGMQVGESRLILIPPAQGYGSKPNGSIPAKSTLLFEVTLESIS